MIDVPCPEHIAAPIALDLTFRIFEAAA